MVGEAVEVVRRRQHRERAEIDPADKHREREGRDDRVAQDEPPPWVERRRERPPDPDPRTESDGRQQREGEPE